MQDAKEVFKYSIFKYGKRALGEELQLALEANQDTSVASHPKKPSKKRCILHKRIEEAAFQKELKQIDISHSLGAN